jgi:hypothetical protein
VVRADVAKALLREAELCAADRRVKTRAVGDDLYVAAVGFPTFAVYSLGGGSREIEVAKEQAATDVGHLPPAVKTTEFTLPWRDGNRGAYHRIV